MRHTRYMAAAGDLLTSLGFFIIGLLSMPMRFLFQIERLAVGAVILVQHRSLSRFARYFVNWQQGYHDAAIASLEGVVAKSEAFYRIHTQAGMRRRVLLDLYTLLTRCYLMMGQVDDAMIVMNRVKKVTGLERLPGIPELDADTAHIVRASLAAGRIMSDKNLAKVLVRQNPPETKLRKSAKILPFKPKLT